MAIVRRVVKHLPGSAVDFNDMAARVGDDHRLVERIDYRISFLLLQQQAPVIRAAQFAQADEHAIKLVCEHADFIS